MKIEGEGQLLRVYIAESDQWEGKPLYAAIIHKARAEGLAGATALRGMMGFGANSLIHSAGQVAITEDLPVVIEMVDKAEKLKAFISVLDKMVKEGLITTERVGIVAYRSSRHP